MGKHSRIQGFQMRLPGLAPVPFGVFVMISLAVSASACGAPEPHHMLGEAKPRPTLLALDRYAASLGTPVNVFGVNFPNEANAHSYRPLPLMRFEGKFYDSEGIIREVSIETVLRRRPDQTLVWDSLGPYTNPFTKTEVIGVFDGTVQIEFFDVGPDGVATQTLEKTDAQPLRFRIEPSIFVRLFRPVESTCSGPVPATLALHPYELEVVTVGRPVRSYSFMMSAAYPDFDDGETPPLPLPTRVDVPAVDNTGSAGQNTAFITPEMPLGAVNYVLRVNVVAHAYNGGTVTSSMAMMTHNPIAIYPVGAPRLAQTYEPVLQGNCNEPAISTSSVRYRETHSETRAIARAETFSDRWGTKLSRGEAQEEGETASTESRYEVSQESSQMEDERTSHRSHWNVGGRSSARTPKPPVGTPPVGNAFKGGTSGEYGESSAFYTSTSRGSRDAQTSGSRQTLGTSRASTTEDTLARNLSQGRRRAEERAFTSTEATAQGYVAELFPYTAGVWYRQLSRYLTEAIVVRYNLCGQEQVIGASYLTSWSWAVDISYGETCSPIPPPDDFGPGKCMLGECPDG